MTERSFDEMIAYFNRRVADMDISRDSKFELLGMVTALGYKHEKSAEERKTGEWISDGVRFKGGCDWMHCSECGLEALDTPIKRTNYCPNCGARMEA